MVRRMLAVLLVCLVLLSAAACARFGGGGAGIDADRAVELVLAQNERFRGIGPYDPELIGQAAWYEVTDTQDGWRVVIRIGWGDCPSGCINQHRWTYEVDRSGEVRLTDEDGERLPAATRIGGVVLSGPTCPVASASPDPSCDDRPVEGAVIVVQDLAGHELARVSTDTDGSFWFELAPGAYRIVPQPVEGLMGTAGPLDVRVEADEPPQQLTIGYDTGIR